MKIIAMLIAALALVVGLGMLVWSGVSLINAVEIDSWNGSFAQISLLAGVISIACFSLSGVMVKVGGIDEPVGR